MKGTWLILAITIFACTSARDQNAESMEAPTIIPKYELAADNSLLSRKGPFIYFKGKKFSGFLVEVHEGKTLKSKVGYYLGKREGASFQYYKSGAMKEKRYYVANDKHGFHQGWWPNGNVKFEYHFDKGVPHGASKEWFKTGERFREFNYEFGKEVGSQKMWQEDGSIRANYVVKDGRRYGLLGLKNCKSVNNEKGIYTALAY